jgi:hypothetical protein
MNVQPQDRKRKLFVWGMVLAWIPAIPILYWIITVVSAFHQKQTGLTAVAGGLSYGALLIVVLFVCPLIAVILLLKAFSTGHLLRATFSVFTICWSGLVLSLFSAYVWLFIRGLTWYSATAK